MNFKIILGLCLVSFNQGKYLLVDIEDHENSVVEPSENRCTMPPCPEWGRWPKQQDLPTPIPPKQNRSTWTPYPEWFRWTKQQDLPTPIPPKQNRHRCIPSGGKCSYKNKFSISIEFSFRSSKELMQCCEGYTCVSGLCMKPRININGLNIGKGMQ